MELRDKILEVLNEELVATGDGHLEPQEILGIEDAVERLLTLIND